MAKWYQNKLDLLRRALPLHKDNEYFQELKWLWNIRFYLFFYFVGTFIQLQINFGIHFFVTFMMLLTNVKHVKYKKNDAVLLWYWHQFQDGHSWTPGNEMWDPMPRMSHCLLVPKPIPWMPTAQPTSYGNYRSTAIIKSLHEITEIAQMWH